MILPATERQGQPVSTESSERPKYEVADIFRLYGEDYRATHSITEKQRSVMFDIEHCRSSVFGYHLDVCDECGHTEPEYNSCRNRHCPKCQGIQKRKWVNARLEDLLPVPYYHVVFTLPDSIFPVCLFNQELIYDLLFDCASETLLTFGRDPKWLGGELGFFGVMHTWGQTLWHHPHVHFVVPGGAIGPNGKWLRLKYKDKFLFPVRALSQVFRNNFTEGLKDAYKGGKLTFPGDLERLEAEESFKGWLQDLKSKEWVVYCKPPFGGPEEVVRYVGQYTHRVAISNHRIVSIDNGHVVFSYRDYKDDSKIKQMDLTADEFIQRFLWHVLPSGFHKIRHYGFLANGKKSKLQGIKEYLTFEEEGSAEATREQREEEFEATICPQCGKGTLRPMVIFDRFGAMTVTDYAYFIGQQTRDTS